MSSGVYAALSGAIAKMQAVETVANNLSNVNTAGFKKERVNFSALLDSASQNQLSGGVNYTYVAASNTDFTQGTMTTTGRDLDVAINGDGFFKVRNGADISYTRLGHFDRALDGTLITANGEQVLNAASQPITLPAGPISIDERGSILSLEGEVGQLAVFNLDDRFLQKEGTGRFIYSGDAAGVVVNAGAQLMQGDLEQSNVKAMQETASMMTSLRGFESYQKAIKTYSTINSKMDDIGSL